MMIETPVGKQMNSAHDINPTLLAYNCFMPSLKETIKTGRCYNNASSHVEVIKLFLMNTLNDRAAIEAMTQRRIDAIKAQDIEKALIGYSKKLIMFDVVGELSGTGDQSATDRLKIWFGTMEKLTDFEICIIDINVGQDVAYCNTFNHIVAIKKDGAELNMWWRETLGLKKIGGEWLVCTAHSSVPFDPQSGQASTGLKPASIHIEEPPTDLSELVKSIFRAYETMDLSACENLLADNFTFTSPHDYRISKQMYLQKCWPFSEEKPVYQLEQVMVSGNEVIVLYTCETKSLKKFKNTEYFRFENEKIRSVEVYFGGDSA